MEIGRRTLMALLGTGAGSRIVDAFAAGSDTPYPTRSITVLLPYTVGGPPDLLVETIKATLEPLWGQTIIAESSAWCEWDHRLRARCSRSTGRLYLAYGKRRNASHQSCRVQDSSL